MKKLGLITSLSDKIKNEEFEYVYDYLQNIKSRYEKIYILFQILDTSYHNIDKFYDVVKDKTQQSNTLDSILCPRICNILRFNEGARVIGKQVQNEIKNFITQTSHDWNNDLYIAFTIYNDLLKKIAPYNKESIIEMFEKQVTE